MHHRIRLATALALALASTLAACDDKAKDGTSSAKEGASAAAVSAKPSAQAPKEEPAPTQTTISLDDVALTVNGDRVPFEGPDAKGRIAAALAGKPKIAGEKVPVAVLRAAKTPKVVLVAAALKEAKAAGVLVRAQKRDNSMSELELSWEAPPPCSAVASIGKDVAISVWTVGGTTAKRFAKGMAGPDLTLGSEGFRKGVNACESGIAILAADDSVTWGLVFDLALATKDSPDSKKLMALKFGLASDAVAGRKVTPL